MNALGTKAGTRTLSIIGGAFFSMAILVGATGTAQASDAADHLSPSPAEIAMLRNLLALQHPSLKASPSTPAPSSSTTLSPAVTGEPLPHDAAVPVAIEGEANQNPAPSRISRLDVGFRATLERAVAAAGFQEERL